MEPTNQNPTVTRFQGLEIESTPRADVNPDLFGNAGGLSVGGRKATQDENGVWRNSIGLESTSGMRHVSKIWQDQCLPMPSVMKSIEEAATTKKDVTVPITDLRVKAIDGELGLDWGDGFHAMNQFATGKLRTLFATGEDDMPTGMVPYFFARPERLGVLANELQEGLNERIGRVAGRKEGTRGKTPASSALLRIRSTPNGPLVRTVLTDKYQGDLDNILVMNMIKEVLADGFDNALWSHAKDDGDRLQGNILLPDSMKSMPDSDYGVGVSMRNSEVGDRAFSLFAFLFRAICLNGCIWDRQDCTIKVKQNHTGVDMDSLRAQVKRAITAATSQGWVLLDLFEQTRTITVKDTYRMMASLARDNSLSKVQTQAWAEGYTMTLQERLSEDMGSTAWALIQGLTLGAQQFEGEDRLKMEAAAGTILAPRDLRSDLVLSTLWSSYEDRAELLDERTVELYTTAR